MLSKNQLGFLYMFLSVCTFSIMDLIVKWSGDYPTGQVMFFRGFFGIIPTFFLIPRERIKTFYKTKRPKEHFFRCIMGLMALVAIFIALRKLPLAIVVSLSFSAPLFITILSIFLLSEKVGIYRWLAVLIGFVGVIIITEPGIEEMNYLYLLPIIFCVGMSFVTITIRKLSSTEPIWLISIFFSIMILIASLMTIPFGWVMPNFHDFILLSLVGIMGGSANLFLTQSYKLSEVSLVAPLKYLSLIFAIIFGYLIWNEVPTTKTLIGASLVVSASLIIFRREIYHKEKIPSATRHE
ncbi:DMT family transporter [Candidatus Pelagibacter sp.]|jgi:drug/metabolite transporter (DMT)-like permease|nr:DMT family transporter [Candidatus Pelagibacter sp.]MDA9957120.1 DMT family transporter [Candidatus Pelagibacter sp.]MDB3895540.1 DMT family transporter [Candidatus Pelagibacter sp.]MDB9923081.1 DMT family transporter [Candidatus Pelagibacter sp.]|tara:strand:+ start:2276 stop:3160 length:885 start_codon:yes stop_codon:yes gene_type:complete